VIYHSILTVSHKCNIYFAVFRALQVNYLRDLQDYPEHEESQARKVNRYVCMVCMFVYIGCHNGSLSQ